MGKGGQRITTAEASSAATTASDNNKAATIWRSPYNPLAKNAPELPSKGEIKAIIPKECFRRSYLRSFYAVAQDLTIAAVFVYGTTRVLTTDLPEDLTNPIEVFTWLAGWSIYAFGMGTIMTGLWVLAHECGHGAFSDRQYVNDIVGFVLHQALLVPYFAWQYTHAKHHRRTNHLLDGESHVPQLAGEVGLVGPADQQVRQSVYAAWHEVMGDGPYALFQIWLHLTLGWPCYLLGVVSTGRLKNDGTPLDGAVLDHFRPHSPMFPPKIAYKVLLSTIATIATLAGLVYAGFVYGHLQVFLWYWCPYSVVNNWLVLYTWLQHSDPSVPHYGEGEWTWVRGALGTIDRPYGIFDFFHHNIGSTHVAHHFFHEMPWYNAKKATRHIRAFLEPKGLYNYDPTFWPLALWRIARTCHYVEESKGLQYFKSLEDVPRSSSRAEGRKVKTS
jgi:fatty acid desaturase